MTKTIELNAHIDNLDAFYKEITEKLIKEQNEIIRELLVENEELRNLNGEQQTEICELMEKMEEKDKIIEAKEKIIRFNTLMDTF